MTREEELGVSLSALRRRIAAACRAAGRSPDDVVLVAVTKGWPASDVAVLRGLGVTDMGENRDGEAAAKAAAVPGVRWHFVGAVQTNKARSVSSYAHVVHSVDRPGLVRALGDGARRAGREVDVLLQLSLDGDPGRSGVARGGLGDLAAVVAGEAGLRLAGLMAVAPVGVDPAAAFAEVAAAAADLRRDHPSAVVVSAGMSADLEQAITTGATHVRVGTALLGPRRAPLR